MPQSAKRCSTERWASVERRDQLRRCIPLTLGDVAASLLGDAALLLGEHRERLGAGEREVLLELGGPHLGLAGENLVESGLAPLDLLLERAVSFARMRTKAATAAPAARQATTAATIETMVTAVG